MHVRSFFSLVPFRCGHSCLYFSREFHREQLSIEHSMQDLDSAVGRLDNILMSVYVVVAVLIIAVALVSFVLHLCVLFVINLSFPPPPGSAIGHTHNRRG